MYHHPSRTQLFQQCFELLLGTLLAMKTNWLTRGLGVCGVALRHSPVAFGLSDPLFG
jgi:hypothetical protein